ncbi:PD-(D/E)XK motif protein [Carnobacterium divergens]|uniref:PD-(D/E)XK motif protein n=1 Tax=Carnobacterium divergens TaxID=2748 RepID=A0AAW8REZ8_CARDV|nr:PD-(D/E)XK motif protein [Carnobacterium divergens]MDT1958790.1 PD-(D/E)XK motif protein [Carnobacterium divergens]MDT1974758.1 PD-(D/E)XK motif protein [Carnobacterium divergens]MPQ22402.1 PD-(D/E)XK motif protein [Carnobacterium divergens]
MSVKNVNSFVLVPHIKIIRVYSGIDNQGMESIAFDFMTRPDFELKTNKISSRIVSIKNIHRLFISLVDDDPMTQEIFEVFSKDIITSIEKAKTEEEVLLIIANRFKYWSDLFKRSKGIYDEKWIQGFCGELWFLDNVLIDKVGCEEAIKSWTGPEKANQDFITSQMVFEIKTKTQQTNSIKISNDNQLSKDMYLSVIEISKSSEVAINSFNLYKLISSIYTKIKNPKIHVEFNRKLLELELFPVDNARVYDKYAYEFVSLTHYKVDNEFPFIDHRNIPKAIIQYSYELSINSIEDFKISEEEIWN